MDSTNNEQEDGCQGPYTLIRVTEADYGCEERPEGAPLMCALLLEAGGRRIFREIPDELCDQLGLVPGMQLTEGEIAQMQEGKKPQGWDDLTHRHYYKTDIGMVCMSAAEYREYRMLKVQEKEK